jgi:hypothetical protein
MAQNLRSTGNQRTNGNQYSVRLDDQFSKNNNSVLLASLFDARQADPFGSGVLQESLLPGFGRNLSTHAINGVAGWTHAFNASVLNESRFGFLTVSGGQTSSNAGNTFAAETGLQGVTTNPLDLGIRRSPLAASSQRRRPIAVHVSNNRDLEFYDNVIWHKGNLISWRMAMHYNLQPVNQTELGDFHSLRDGPRRGGFNRRNALLTSCWVSNHGAGWPWACGHGRHNQLGHFYVQDNWQISPNLKIDVGFATSTTEHDRH